MPRFRFLLFLGSFLSLTAAHTAWAQTDPGHPRVNEVTNWLDSQAARTNAEVARRQIGPWRAGRDRAADARVSRQLSRDEALHGGHITVSEQNRMNRELNATSTRIYDQRH